MARVTTVKSAQQRKNPDGSLKPNLHCARCRKEIKPGDSYYWVALRIGRSSQRKNFCFEHYPRPSELTTSDKLSRLYAIQENIGDAAGRDDIAQALRDGAEEANAVAEEYTESADNIEEGFGHETYQSTEIREKAEAVEEWAQVLDNAADEVEALDESDAQDVSREQVEEDDGERDPDESDEDYAARIDKLFEEAVEEALDEIAREKADDASAELSV